MTDAETLDGLIASSLGLDEPDIKGAAYGVTPSWDSVAHLMLMSAIEERFGISLDPSDVSAMSDYSAIRDILSKRYGLANDA